MTASCPAMSVHLNSRETAMGKKLGCLVFACYIAVASSVHADQRAYVIHLVEESSRGGCWKGGGGPGDTYVVEIANGTISLANANSTASPQLKKPVPKDGVIKAEYRSAAGGRMEFTGNLNTSQYELLNISTSCRYRLVPKQ